MVWWLHDPINIPVFSLSAGGFYIPDHFSDSRQTNRREGGRKEGRYEDKAGKKELYLKKNITPKIPQQISIYISLAVTGLFLPTRETGKYL